MQSPSFPASTGSVPAYQTSIISNILMKKLLHTLLLFAVGLFAACQAPTSGGDVYLNDFLDDLTAQTDAGPAIRAALSHCARIRAARLILPGGELRIRPDLAVEKYQFISNNDEGLKRIAFDLVGLQDSPLKVLTRNSFSQVSFHRSTSNVAATSRSAIFRSTLPARFTPKVPYGRPETDGSIWSSRTNTDAI